MTSIAAPIPAPSSASNNRTKSALRVAGTIEILKIVVVVLTLLAGLFALVGAFADSSGSESGMYVGVFVASLASATVTYVLFGWLEHTLRTLVAIAVNINS